MTDEIPSSDTEFRGGQVERVSDQETESQLRKLVVDFWSLYEQQGVLGMANYREYTQRWSAGDVARDVAGIVGRSFVFFDESSGKRTIASALDDEAREIERQTKIVKGIAEMAEDENSYTPEQLEDKKRRERMAELRQRIATTREEKDSLGNRTGVFTKILSGRRVTKLDEQMAEMRRQHRDLEEAIHTAVLPHAAQALYEELIERQHGLEEQRDCKIPAVVLAYTLDYLQGKLELPIEVALATVRGMPHPFVRV